ncbi:MAG: SpoIIE family protein phosphatase [Deltaproteobacteria bacterium]|nr:SpoIIE family protein phosphatase [Deltaproteobacteria bacterium]
MKKHFNFNLTAKMTLLILGGTVLVFVLVLGKAYLTTRDLIDQESKKHMSNLAISLAASLEQRFRAITKISQGLATVLDTQEWDSRILHQLLYQNLQRNPEIYGMTITFKPHAYKSDQKYYSVYYYRNGSGIRSTFLGSDSYNYFQMDWYILPKELQKPAWTEPYFDEGGGEELMCTYGVPFYSQDPITKSNQFLGITTADISLKWLSDFINSADTGEKGYAFLITETGRFIVHPQERLIMRDTIFSLAEEAGQPQLRDLGRKMIQPAGGEDTGQPQSKNLGRKMIQPTAGYERISSVLSPGPAVVAFSKVPSTGWSVAVVLPEEELFAELNRHNHRTVLMAVAGICLLLVVILFIARSVTGPIRSMVAATSKIAEGDLNVDLSGIRSRDEVGRLAAAFTHMSSRLQQYIKELTETTAANEKIRSELNIAAQIQASILPSTFPPFPDRDDFNLFAKMKPAREIGGDFYDFFLIDEERLALVVADVSGKGVPAALFMMVSRTLIRSLANQDKSPAEVLAEANDLLCQGNDAAMFVTTFLAYYHIPTGKLVMSNAGHNPPFHLDSKGVITPLPKPPGTALGFTPGLIYKEKEFSLLTGETLIFYTDGITEACTPDGQFFGEERLIALLSQFSPLDLEESCHRIIDLLDEFQAGEQFDDITIMMLRKNR